MCNEPIAIQGTNHDPNDYRGKVSVPDEEVELPVGQQLRLQIELANFSTPRFADLLELEADLPDAPPDLAAQHDHYLHGSPRR